MGEVGSNTADSPFVKKTHNILIFISLNKKVGAFQFEVFGDDGAVEVVCQLIRDHGWRPIVRGGVEEAPYYEGGIPSVGRVFGNIWREIRHGEKLSVGW